MQKCIRCGSQVIEWIFDEGVEAEEPAQYGYRTEGGAVHNGCALLMDEAPVDLSPRPSDEEMHEAAKRINEEFEATLAHDRAMREQQAQERADAAQKGQW